MNLQQFKSNLKKISAKGFIPSKRRGNTGIGYTLETLLELKENNIRLPDLGRIELKSKRRNASSFVTMFTFNRGVWRIPQSSVIKRYGYRDMSKRQALKCTVTIKPNPQGLRLTTNNNGLQLRDQTGYIIASWDANSLMEYFAQKLPSLILVIANTRIDASGREHFHYTQAYLLKNPSKKGLLKLIRQGHVVVDLRMHLKNIGQVRNRGTAFRVSEGNLLQCFTKRINLL
jgi:hypothetical protein